MIRKQLDQVTERLRKLEDAKPVERLVQPPPTIIKRIVVEAQVQTTTKEIREVKTQTTVTQEIGVQVAIISKADKRDVDLFGLE